MNRRKRTSNWKHSIFLLLSLFASLWPSRPHSTSLSLPLLASVFTIYFVIWAHCYELNFFSFIEISLKASHWTFLPRICINELVMSNLFPFEKKSFPSDKFFSSTFFKGFSFRATENQSFVVKSGKKWTFFFANLPIVQWTVFTVHWTRTQKCAFSCKRVARSFECLNFRRKKWNLVRKKPLGARTYAKNGGWGE